MNFLNWLDTIQPRDRPWVGDKAFYLSQLMQRGYPVIPGFVVKSSTLQEFLESIDWLEPMFADLSSSSLHLDLNNPRQLGAIAQRIRQEIQAAELPSNWLALLSEAAAQLQASSLILRPSFALQAKDRLDLQAYGLWQSHICWSNPEAIAASLKLAWAELFRARSLLYWQRCGIQLQQINLAILVQPIGNATVSGTLQASSKTFEIQSAWGLGLSLVLGEVLPDYYQFNSETEDLLVQRLGQKTILYELATATELSASEELLSQSTLHNPLQTRLLKESLVAHSTLNRADLTQIIDLAQRLKAEWSSTYTLEWTLHTASMDIGTDGRAIAANAQLYLTQVTPGLPQDQLSELLAPSREPQNPLPFPSPSVMNSTPNSQLPLLRGLAAAPGRSLSRAIVIDRIGDRPEPIPPGAILVVETITTDYLPLLHQVTGIVAEQGGLTSHGAILARELGIPAIVSAVGATQIVHSGDALLIDGSTGEIYRQTPEAIAESPSFAQFQASSIQPTQTVTQVFVNLSQSSSIERTKSLPIDGVGLLRSELMIPEVLDNQHPHLWLQQDRHLDFLQRWTEQISRFAAAFAPRPVYYRSLDLSMSPDLGLKQQLEQGHLWSTDAVNPDLESSSLVPMLGLRGTFSYMLNPNLFDLELKALANVHQAGYTNVHLLLPFVRTVEEFAFCRSRVQMAGLNLKQIQIWIMAEVPSVLFLLPEYVKAGVQGISIGTNDLTQLLLGVDRDLGVLASAFDWLHPAVMRAIKQLIDTARDCGIPCSICGQAPTLYPELVESLIQWGITSISVDLSAVETTAYAIARAEQRLLLEAARRQLKQQ